MNKKELGQIRRRMAVNKNNIHNIYGCYVNTSKEVISYLEENLSMMRELEAEKYLGFLKKTISGTLGKNLIDIVFSTQQVVDSEEHKLLMRLRKSKMSDSDARDEFYKKVIESVDMPDTNYVILLAAEAYDVPNRGADGEIQHDGSDNTFTYFLCAICPVKDGKPELGYSHADKFHGFESKQVVAMPELGFMFPAFDDGSANIYNALFYSRNTAMLYDSFINTVFNVETPMSPDEQKESFRSVLTSTLEGDCNIEIVQSVYGQIRDRIEAHKESKDPEPLDITVDEVSDMLEKSGVEEDKIEVFQTKCSEEFGEGTTLKPANIIDSGKFELVTPQAKISVVPDQSHVLETKIIDGKKYILIPFDEAAELNGFNITIPTETE